MPSSVTAWGYINGAQLSQIRLSMSAVISTSYNGLMDSKFVLQSGACGFDPLPVMLVTNVDPDLIVHV